jgi:hypothetical protein
MKILKISEEIDYKNDSKNNQNESTNCYENNYAD